MSGESESVSLGRRVKCEIRFGSYNMWIRAVVSGFFDLHHSGQIELTVKSGEAPLGLAPVVAAVIDRQTRVFYDGHDGYNFLAGADEPSQLFDQMLDECDLWFKYNCLESEHVSLRNRGKIRPLGLSSCFFGSRHNPFDIGLAPANLRQLVKTMAGSSDFVSTLTAKNSRHAWPEHYEVGPSLGDGRVLYVARAWDPGAPEVKSQRVRDDRTALNEFRADVVRAGRRILADRFVGGLQRNDHAVRCYPDCIYDGAEATNRWSYLKTMRRVSVGIAGGGLHGCAGGKLAEYLAASRAVVTTPLPMLLPGGFTSGVHYLEVASGEEAIWASVALLGDSARLSAMMSANHAYYGAYVRPSSLILRTVRDAINEASGV